MTHTPFDLDMNPHDRLLAGIIVQAIADLAAGPPCPTQSIWVQAARSEYWAARCFLAQLGLLDDAGELVRPDVVDLALMWVGTG